MDGGGSRGRWLGREVAGLLSGAILEGKSNRGISVVSGVEGGSVARGVGDGAALFRGESREEVLGIGAGVRTFLVLFLVEEMDEAPTTPALRGGGASTIPKASRSAAVPLRCRSISGYAFLIRC